METWSSWPAEVGIESTELGWQMTLFSETSEAAVYWATMKPEFRPGRAVRKAGSPLESAGLTRRSTRRSEMLPSSAMAIAIKSNGSASGWPWKWPAEIASSSLAKISGLSVTALISIWKTPRAWARVSRLAPWTWGAQRRE